MRFLIDSTQVPVARTGVGIYVEQLIREILPVISPEDVLFILLQKDDVRIQAIIAGHSNVRSIVLQPRVFRNRIALAFYEQCVLPFVLLYHRIDLIHSIHYTFPLICPCPRIVTIHDLTFILWPRMHTLSKRIIMPFFIKMAMRHAAGILFVSESTQKDAEDLFGSGVNIRRVAPLGVNDSYFNPVPREQIENTLSRLKINAPYILYLGTLEPRKNILRLVQAFERIAKNHPGHLLVIAGRLGWDYGPSLKAIEESSLKSKIIRLGYIEESDKIPLIAGSDLMVYPSLYEGFGLPVLEGMAIGVPVITGNTSSLPEVAANGAVCLDTNCVDELSAGISKILDLNWDEREQLSLRARAQAQQFRWSRTAHITYQTYLLFKKR